MGNDRYISSKVIKELYEKSGNKCAFPNCRCELFYDETNMGEICHIEGLKPESVRYNPALSDNQRNSIENLILLCPSHHKLIDSQNSKYTVEQLKQMKASHEDWIAK